MKMFRVGGLVVAFTHALNASALTVPLPVREALDQRGLQMQSDISLSADGRWVAIPLSDPQLVRETPLGYVGRHLPSGAPPNAFGLGVSIVNTRTGQMRDLTEGVGNSWGAIWSPDSRKLAFFSDRDGEVRVWMWDADTAALKRVTHDVADRRLPIRWAPDSRRVLIGLYPSGYSLASELKAGGTVSGRRHYTIEGESGAVVRVYRHSPKTPSVPIPDESVAKERVLSDLTLVDVATGEIRRLTAGGRSLRWTALSPDGAHIAFTQEKPAEDVTKFQIYLSTMWVVPVAGGEPRQLVPRLNGYAAFSWSPDGKGIAFLEHDRPAEEWLTNCYYVPIDGSTAPRNLIPTPHPTFGHLTAEGDRAPIWSRDGRELILVNPQGLWRVQVDGSGVQPLASIPGREHMDVVSHNRNSGRYWSPDGGRSLVVLVHDPESGREGFYSVDLQTGRHARLLEEDKNYGGRYAHHRLAAVEGSGIVFGAQAVDDPLDLWFIDGRNFSRPRRLTRLNPSTDRYVLGRSRLISWQTVDGTKLRGAVLLPANYRSGQRYPLIVHQYPGRKMSNEVNSYGLNPSVSSPENWQLFATRGYAVLLADTVSSGTGHELWNTTHSVVPAIDRLVEEGIVDSARVAIHGGSAGGQAVLSAMVTSNRFKTGVSFAAPGSIINTYGVLDPDGSAVRTGLIHWSMGGSLWEERDSYIENSPLFYLDRFHGSLLIIQGDSDVDVPPFQADQVFVSLRILDKEVEYARYAGVGHGFDSWGYASKLDYLERMIRWFDTQLSREVSCDQVNPNTCRAGRASTSMPWRSSRNTITPVAWWTCCCRRSRTTSAGTMSCSAGHVRIRAKYPEIQRAVPARDLLSSRRASTGGSRRGAQVSSRRVWTSQVGGDRQPSDSTVAWRQVVMLVDYERHSGQAQMEISRPTRP